MILKKIRMDIMNKYVDSAKQYIEEGNIKEALQLARKQHGNDDE